MRRALDHFSIVTWCYGKKKVNPFTLAVMESIRFGENFVAIFLYIRTADINLHLI